MAELILVLNCGSSSIKAALFPLAGGDVPVLTALVENIGEEPRLRMAGETQVLAPGAGHEALLDGLLDALEARAPVKVALAGTCFI